MAAASFGRGSIHGLEAARSSCFKLLLSPLSGAHWLRLRNDDTCTFSRSRVVVQVQARIFGPASFEASKLNVLFLGVGKDTRPDELPRAYTLTHCDITSKLTLTVAQTINKAQIQGWYNRLQRDEVLAEWRKSQGRMSLHVHCHISGGHWLLNMIAHLRFYIFCKELPVVLEAFRHGDVTLFRNHPELEEAQVWVYFHSNEKEYNRVECWGPLQEAAKGARKATHNIVDIINEQRLMSPMDSSTTIMMESVDVSSSSEGSASGDWKVPMMCPHPCKCCFPALSAIPLPPSFQN